MRKGLLLLSLLACSLASQSQTDLFSPVKSTALRAPSVPLLASNPYFQVWSNGDNLYSQPTTHWTGGAQPLAGYVRVDGVTYQFMGTANVEFNSEQSILPSSQFTPDQPYKAQVMVFNTGQAYVSADYNHIWGVPPTDANNKDWFLPEYSLTNGDNSWAEQTAPFSSDQTYKGQTSYQWVQSGIMGEIYMRRTFTLTEPLTSDVYLTTGHDDAPSEWYINGVLVYKATDGWNNDDRVLLTEAQKALIKTDGTPNVLAVHVHQNWGGAFADCGLYRATMNMSKVVLGSNQTGGPWDCAYYLLNNNSELNSLTPADWAAPSVDETDWIKGQGPFSNGNDMFNVTGWDSNNHPLLIRRHFNLTATQLQDLMNSQLNLSCSYDEYPNVYLNGQLIWSANGWNDNNYANYTLTPEQKALLVEGDNVLAISLQQGGGGGHIDLGMQMTSSDIATSTTATQKGLAKVMPTQTYYQFTAGPVDLNVVFTSPQMMDNTNMFGTPINYVSYQVNATDSKAHQVQVYLMATPQMALASDNNICVTQVVQDGGLSFVKTGSQAQSLIETPRINWGYFYMAADAARNQSVGFAPYVDGLSQLQATGNIPTPANGEAFVVGGGSDFMPGLIFKDDLGSGISMSGFTVLGYDNDSKAIKNNLGQVVYPSYWSQNGTLTSQMAKFATDYTANMMASRTFDEKIFTDAEKAGGTKYAEVAALAYRQVASATDLVVNENKEPLLYTMGVGFWNKTQPMENAYALAPVLALYNPSMLQSLITSTLQYAKDNAITNNDGHAPHTLGNYPVLGGWETNYKVESTADILTAIALGSKVGVANDALEKYYDIMLGWANALYTYVNDDTKFTGQQNINDEGVGLPNLGNNENLRVKGIIALAGFAQVADKLGHAVDAQDFKTMAQTLSVNWDNQNNAGTFYVMSNNATWGQKYALVYDKILGTNLFTNALQTEAGYYLSKLAEGAATDFKYGLAMDARQNNRAFLGENYMTAAVESTVADFQTLTDPLYNYINETTTRVPLRTYYNNTTAEGLTAGNAQMASFNASPLIGMLWTKVLVDKMPAIVTDIQGVENQVQKTDTKVYNLQGQYVGTSTNNLPKGVYIVGNKKVVVK